MKLKNIVPVLSLAGLFYSGCYTVAWTPEKDLPFPSEKEETEFCQKYNLYGKTGDKYEYFYAYAWWWEEDYKPAVGYGTYQDKADANDVIIIEEHPAPPPCIDCYRPGPVPEPFPIVLPTPVGGGGRPDPAKPVKQDRRTEIIKIRETGSREVGTARNDNRSHTGSSDYPSGRPSGSTSNPDRGGNSTSHNPGSGDSGDHGRDPVNRPNPPANPQPPVSQPTYTAPQQENRGGSSSTDDTRRGTSNDRDSHSSDRGRR